MAQMQNMFYDEAPYHILFYDDKLDAYRTDKFGGWKNQPTANGVPLFGYGSFGYTLLTAGCGGLARRRRDGVAPSDAAWQRRSPAAPSGDGSGDSASSTWRRSSSVRSSSSPLVAGGLVLMRRRSAPPTRTSSASVSRSS